MPAMPELGADNCFPLARGSMATPVGVGLGSELIPASLREMVFVATLAISLQARLKQLQFKLLVLCMPAL